MVLTSLRSRYTDRPGVGLGGVLRHREIVEKCASRFRRSSCSLTGLSFVLIVLSIGLRALRTHFLSEWIGTMSLKEAD